MSMGNNNRWLKSRKRHQILIAKIQRIAGGSLIAALIVGPLIYFSVVAMPLEMRDDSKQAQSQEIAKDVPPTGEIGIASAPELRISSTPIPLPEEDLKLAKIIAKSEKKDLKLEPVSAKFEVIVSEPIESAGGNLSPAEEVKFESFFGKQDAQIKKIKIGEDLPQAEPMYDLELEMLNPETAIPQLASEKANKNRENNILIIDDLTLEDGPAKINKKDDAEKTAEKALQKYLRSELKSADFRIFKDTGILDKNKKPYQFVLSTVKQNNGKWYVTYQQYSNALPVFDGDLKLIFTDEKKLLTISDNIKRDLPDESEFIIGKAVVTQNVKDLFEWDDSIDEIEFIDKGYFEGQPAYRASTNAHDPLGEWEIYVDGVEGNIESLTANIRLQDVPSTPQVDYSSTPEPSTGGTDEPEIEILDALFSQILGTIYPQTPSDPITTEPLSSAYTYIDTAQYETDFQGYFENASMEWYSTFLDGPNVTIHDDDATSNMEIVNQTPEAPFVWDENSASLAAINAFYHTNKIHDYFVNNHGYEVGENVPLTVNSTLVDAYIDGCGAWFNNTEKTIEMGRGGTASCPAELNYALGSDMVYHEYAHFMVEDITHLPNILGAESAAMGEGLADYFAATINDDPMWGDVISPARRRNLENTLNYNNDMTGESHHDGMILSGALWDLRTEIGQEATDELVFNTLFQDRYHYETFMYGMIIEDDDNGDFSDGTPHLAEIITAFDNHGIGPGIAGFNGLPLTPEAWAELLGEEIPEGEEGPLMGAFTYTGTGCHFTNVGVDLWDLDVYDGGCQFYGTATTWTLRNITVSSNPSCGVLNIGSSSATTSMTVTNIDVNDGCYLYMGYTGAYNTTLNASTLDVRDGSVFYERYNASYSNLLAVIGNITAYHPSTITFADNAISTAGGLITYGSGLVQVGAGTTSGRLDVNGTAYLRNGGDVTIYNTVSRFDSNGIENGDSNYSGGTLTNNGGNYNYGAVNLYDSGASIVNTYRFYTSGTLTVAGGSTITNSTPSSSSDFQVAGATSITQGKITNNGYLDLDSTLTITGSSSELEANSYGISVVGTTTLDGGFIDHNGGTTTTTTIEVNGSSYIDQDGGTLSTGTSTVTLWDTSYIDKDGGDFNPNHLTIESTATTAFDQAGASGSTTIADNLNLNSTTNINNHTGRALNIGDDVWNGTGTYTMVNDGTITIGPVGGSSTRVFDITNNSTVTNNGTMEVDSGGAGVGQLRSRTGGVLTNNGTITAKDVYVNTAVGAVSASIVNNATGNFDATGNLYIYSGGVGIVDGGDFDVTGTLTMEGDTTTNAVFANYDDSVSIGGDAFLNGYTFLANYGTGDLALSGRLTMADAGNDANSVGNSGNINIGNDLFMENTNCTYLNYYGSTTTVYDDVILGQTTQSTASIANAGTFDIIGSSSNTLQLYAGTSVANSATTDGIATFNVDSTATTATDGITYVYGSSGIDNTGYDGTTDYSAVFNTHRLFNGQEGIDDGGIINNNPFGDFNVTQTGTTDAAVTMYRGVINHDDGATDFDVDGAITMQGITGDESVLTVNESGSSTSISLLQNSHMEIDGLTGPITWDNNSAGIAIMDYVANVSIPQPEEGYLAVTSNDTLDNAGNILMGDTTYTFPSDYRAGYIENDGTINAGSIAISDTGYINNNVGSTLTATAIGLYPKTTGVLGSNSRIINNEGDITVSQYTMLSDTGAIIDNSPGSTYTDNLAGPQIYDLYIYDGSQFKINESGSEYASVDIAGATYVIADGKLYNRGGVFKTDKLFNGHPVLPATGAPIPGGYVQNGWWDNDEGVWERGDMLVRDVGVNSTKTFTGIEVATVGEQGGEFDNDYGDLVINGDLELKGDFGLELNYATQTEDFHVGTTVTLTGATSGATAYISKDADSGLTGTLTVGGITGTFSPGEIITDDNATPGSATLSSLGSGTTYTAYFQNQNNNSNPSTVTFNSGIYLNDRSQFNNYGPVTSPGGVIGTIEGTDELKRFYNQATGDIDAAKLEFYETGQFFNNVGSDLDLTQHLWLCDETSYLQNYSTIDATYLRIGEESTTCAIGGEFDNVGSGIVNISGNGTYDSRIDGGTFNQNSTGTVTISDILQIGAPKPTDEGLFHQYGGSGKVTVSTHVDIDANGRYWVEGTTGTDSGLETPKLFIAGNISEEGRMQIDGAQVYVSSLTSTVIDDGGILENNTGTVPDNPGFEDEGLVTVNAGGSIISDATSYFQFNGALTVTGAAATAEIDDDADIIGNLTIENSGAVTLGLDSNVNVGVVNVTGDLDMNTPSALFNYSVFEVQGEGSVGDASSTWSFFWNKENDDGSTSSEATFLNSLETHQAWVESSTLLDIYDDFSMLDGSIAWLDEDTDYEDNYCQTIVGSDLSGDFTLEYGSALYHDCIRPGTLPLSRAEFDVADTSYVYGNIVLNSYMRTEYAIVGEEAQPANNAIITHKQITESVPETNTNNDPAIVFLLQVLEDMIINPNGYLNVNDRAIIQQSCGRPCGGSHGGAGQSAGTPGPIYGQMDDFVTEFGRSGYYTTDTPISYGGGKITVMVGNNLTHNGTITANGQDHIYGPASGGSVNLYVAGTFTGSGDITANGGSSSFVGTDNNTRAGGGGRIFIIHGDYIGWNNFTGDITAWGGVDKRGTLQSPARAGTGTIVILSFDLYENTYHEYSDPTYHPGGTLIIDGSDDTDGNYYDIDVDLDGVYATSDPNDSTIMSPDENAETPSDTIYFDSIQVDRKASFYIERTHVYYFDQCLDVNNGVMLFGPSPAAITYNYNHTPVNVRECLATPDPADTLHINASLIGTQAGDKGEKNVGIPNVPDITPDVSAVHLDGRTWRDDTYGDASPHSVTHYQLQIDETLVTLFGNDTSNMLCNLDNQALPSTLTNNNATRMDIEIPPSCGSNLSSGNTYYWRIRYMEDQDGTPANGDEYWGLWSMTNTFNVTDGGSIAVGTCSEGTLAINLGNTPGTPAPHDKIINLPDFTADEEKCNITLDSTSEVGVHVMKNQTLTHTNTVDTLTDMPAVETALGSNVGFYIDSISSGLLATKDPDNNLFYNFDWHQLRTATAQAANTKILTAASAIAAGDFDFWFGADIDLDTLAGIYSAEATVILTDNNP